MCHSSFCYCHRSTAEETLDSKFVYNNRYGRFGNIKLKSVVITVAALVFILFSPCPCLSLSQSEEDYLGEEYVDSDVNKTFVPRIRNKHAPNCNTYFYIGDENASLPCIGVGEPMPQMKWKLIQGNNRTVSRHLAGHNWTLFQSPKNEFVNCTLRFPRIVKRFEGVYRCIAINAYGNDTLDFNVKILDPNRFWRGKPGIFIAFLAILVLVAGIINKTVKLECCQQSNKKKQRVSAGYKKELTKDSGIEEVCMLNPDTAYNSADADTHDQHADMKNTPEMKTC